MITNDLLLKCVFIYSNSYSLYFPGYFGATERFWCF